MAKQLDFGTIIFDNNPRIIDGCSVVGEKESAGPLGSYFDNVITDDIFGEKSFEKCERAMLKMVLEQLVNKLQLQKNDVDIIIGGDLLNQIISMSFVAREFDAQFLGIYGACSTMAESIILASSLLEAGCIKNAICATGTHFSSAERQYRFPLDLGTQRPPSSQWTVTGSGASFISSGSNGIRICKATVGKVIDYGISDVNNMGAAMAPACTDTLVRFFNDTNAQPTDYDAIFTGDLGKLGGDILCDLMLEKGFDIRNNHYDCGAMIYHTRPDMFQGGSGAGCSAVVLNAYILRQMREKKLNKVLFIATGALLSTVSSQQGESIPCIAHLVELQN